MFSAGELARATGRPVRQIRELIRTAAIPTVDGRLVARPDAVRACRVLIDGGPAEPVGTSKGVLFSRDRAGSTRSSAAFDRRYIPAAGVAPRSNTAGMLPRRALSARYAPRGAEPRVENGCSTDVFSGAGRIAGLGATPNFPYGLLVSGSVHAAMLAVILIAAAVAVPGAVSDKTAEPPTDLVRLVFVAEPGPEGGGGGGGLRQPVPPPKAERKGTRRASSPLPQRRPPTLVAPRPRPVRPPPPRPPPRPIPIPLNREPPPPPPLDHEPLPALLASLVAVPADTRDMVGLLSQVIASPAPETASRGSGTGGGVGSESGVGVGQGTGRGVGPGEGGGIGGGPYRPGSGIEPPSLLREVTPDYTEQARRAGLEGEVLLELVVGPDGRVSDLRVLRALGAGLDEEAVRAVRQWRFSPARRLGSPVAVIVEVAVEFKLR